FYLGGDGHDALAVDLDLRLQPFGDHFDEFFVGVGGCRADVGVEHAAVGDDVAGGAAFDGGDGERWRAEKRIFTVERQCVEPLDVAHGPQDGVVAEVGAGGMG